MGYSGQTFQILCSEMGYNGNPNLDVVPPTAMIDSSKNVNIHEGGIGTRGGTSHLDASAISGSPRIMGLHDYSPTSGTQYIVRCTADGKIYTDLTTAAVSSLGTVKYWSFATMNDKLYLCNGYNPPQILSGATPSVLATLSADWSGAGYYPQQMLVHGYGNSERMWAIGVNQQADYTNYLNYIYYSGDNDSYSEANFSEGEGGQLYIETGHRNGLTAMVEFQDRLICFSKEKSFIILDTDASLAKWGYKESGWKGGCSHFRLAIVIPNDIICMMDDGEIYSVTATQNYGDYKYASLIRPSYMQKWMQDNIDLSQIDKFHACYDPQLRCINFWMVRKNFTICNTCLCYFIDKTPDKAWSIKENLINPSGWSASCSALVKESDTYRVYTGDHEGYVWKTEITSTYTDNALAYWSGVKTPPLSFGNPRSYKRYDKLRIVVRPKGSYTLNTNVYVDNKALTSGTISLSGTGSLFGSAVFGTAIFSSELSLIDKEIEIGDAGLRMQTELYNSDADGYFFLSQIMIDWKPLGSKP